MAKTKRNNRAPSVPVTTRGYNHYNTDSNLHRLLDRHYPDMLARQSQTLESFGHFASTQLDDQAAYSDRIAPPVLKQSLDTPHAPTQRRGRVFINNDYKDCQQEMYRHGILARCFDEQQPEPHMLSFLGQYLASYTDISTGCPLAMTHPNALILATHAPDHVRAAYLPQFLRTDGKTMIGGTWATEWAGGSDIRGNTETRITAHDESTARCTVEGRNYFSSAMGFESWGVVKTARYQGEDDKKEGLALVFIPSHLDDKWDDAPETRTENAVNIAHLKEKSGTKGLPTAEVEINGATGYMVADSRNGLRTMMEALGCSRVHNAMGAAGVMHRAYNEALFWAANRNTFGDSLLTREDIQADLVHLKTEWLGGTALAFEAARAFDDTLTGAQKPEWLRLCTALAKYHTADQATESTTRATEIIGGTGYTQDHPIERIHRDAMVLRVWEGPKNIQAREMLGMLSAGGADAFTDRLAEIDSALPDSMKTERRNIEKLGKQVAATFKDMSKNKGLPPAQAPVLMQGMSKILTYALLCEEAAYELDLYQDQSKLFTAQSYYALNDLANLSLQPPKTALHNVFDRMVANDIVPVNTGKKTPSP